jgi:hypothetical protein
MQGQSKLVAEQFAMKTFMEGQHYKKGYSGDNQAWPWPLADPEYQPQTTKKQQKNHQPGETENPGPSPQFQPLQFLSGT